MLDFNSGVNDNIKFVAIALVLAVCVFFMLWSAVDLVRTMWEVCAKRYGPYKYSQVSTGAPTPNGLGNGIGLTDFSGDVKRP